MIKTITPLKSIMVLLTVIIVAACNTSKKTSNSTAKANPPATTTTPSITTAPVVTVAKSADGIYSPGIEELRAIQMQYQDVTLEKLKQGHTIYTFGACAGCHRPQSIYRYSEVRWKDIIDDMAKKAEMSEPDKDAVYKYVLSIKAVQPR